MFYFLILKKFYKKKIRNDNFEVSKNFKLRSGYKF